MGNKRKRPISREMGERILKLFESEPEWKPTEIPWESILGLGLVRKEDTLAIWISGSYSNPQLAQVENAIAGIDVLAIETNPKLEKNEPRGNAYHYILQKISDENFPFILYGPLEEGAIISHWYNYKDLDVYLKHRK
jgi:hypothetical protein